MRRVTFSRNFTLSLSRTCQCYCKYCSFATHRPHLYSPEEVERLLDDSERRGAKELLVLTGERPDVNAEVAARLSRLRAESRRARQRARQLGAVPQALAHQVGKRCRADPRSLYAEVDRPLRRAMLKICGFAASAALRRARGTARST